MQVKCNSKYFGVLYGHQQAQPQTVFDWKFWEKAARDPKMSTYLDQGVKAKMFETTPFVNTVGTQHIATCAKIELACDFIREQDAALSTRIGLADGRMHPASDCDNTIAKTLLTDLSNTWSTMVMRTLRFHQTCSKKSIHVIKFFCPAHRPGCPQWRPAQTMLGRRSVRTQRRCHCRVLS